MAQKSYIYRVYDVEHEGDLQPYKDEIYRHGGVVTETRIDYEEEMGVIRFSLDESQAAAVGRALKEL